MENLPFSSVAQENPVDRRTIREYDVRPSVFYDENRRHFGARAERGIRRRRTRLSVTLTKLRQLAERSDEQNLYFFPHAPDRSCHREINFPGSIRTRASRWTRHVFCFDNKRRRYSGLGEGEGQARSAAVTTRETRRFGSKGKTGRARWSTSLDRGRSSFGSQGCV